MAVRELPGEFEDLSTSSDRNYYQWENNRFEHKDKQVSSPIRRDVLQWLLTSNPKAEEETHSG